MKGDKEVVGTLPSRNRRRLPIPAELSPTELVLLRIRIATGQVVCSAIVNKMVSIKFLRLFGSTLSTIVTKYNNRIN